MKRLFVAFILILSVAAHAETPASVRIRVRLPFDPGSQSAVVLPKGTRVMVLWPEDDKLMIRYRRVEGLVPAVTIDYVASAHPGDVRQYRPEASSEERENRTARAEPTSNTYHAQSTTANDSDGALGVSFPVNKILIGGVVAVVVLILASAGKKKDDDGPFVRRPS